MVMTLLTFENRIFPYMVAASALGLAFLVLILVLIALHILLPEIIILGSFILCVLWFTGLVGTALQLYGSSTNVNSNCQNFVSNQEFKGASINTLAWLTQINVCKCLPLATLGDPSSGVPLDAMSDNSQVTAGKPRLPLKS
jgi:hypothetical protein